MFSPKLKPRSAVKHKEPARQPSPLRKDDLEGSYEVPHETPVMEDEVVDKLFDVYNGPSFLDDLQASYFKAPEEQADDYVILDKDDAIEAMAFFIAQYVQTLPEANNLTPQQLQEALRATFQALKSHRLQKVWSATRRAYRYAAISYSVFRLYEHPWVMRAVMGALWAASKTAYAMLL